MDHLARIQKAIDFIEDHLREELTTREIAKVAAFSTWHFQRVFSATVGDTVKGYVRGRRLSAALTDLTTSDRRILDIALDYQFESQESFTRAFKAAFSRTPGECRRLGLATFPSQEKRRITMEYLDHLYGGMTMQPTIKALEEKYLVGMSTRFISIRSPEKNNHIVLPKLWQGYMAKRDQIKGTVSLYDIGLCECIPDSDDKAHPEECFYMAGAEVPAEDLNDIPEGMEIKRIPAGRYAVFTHKGKLDKLEHTMNFIYGSWLPKSGEELRDAPDLEVYDHRFKFESDDSEVDLYIPLK